LISWSDSHSKIVPATPAATRTELLLVGCFGDRGKERTHADGAVGSRGGHQWSWLLDRTQGRLGALAGREGE